MSASDQEAAHLEATQRREATLDPDAPDPWAELPTRHLSSQACAVRLLRLIAGWQRGGAPPEATLAAVVDWCREVLELPPGPDDGAPDATRT